MAKTLQQLAEEKAKRLKQKQRREAKKPVKVDYEKIAREKTQKARAEKTSGRVAKATADATKPSGQTIKSGKPGPVRNPPAVQASRVPAVQTSGSYVPPKTLPSKPPLQIGYSGPMAKGATEAEIAASRAKIGPHKYIPKPKNPPTPGSGMVSKVLSKIPGATTAGKVLSRGSALTGVTGVAATAKDIARSTITPRIEEQQRAQYGREAAYPTNFPDPMTPEAQQRAADIGIDRRGMGFGGATAQPKEVQQWPRVDPTSGVYEPQGTTPVLVGSKAQIPTAMHQFGSLPGTLPQDNVRPATALEFPPLTPEEQAPGATIDGSPGIDFDYEFNPRTSSFEAKPYKPRKVQNVTIQDELAGASLGGLGALWAINLASKVASGKTAANRLNEENRMAAAQSEQDWNRQRLDYDKYELDREKTRLAAAMAPAELQFQQARTELARKQAEGTLSKQETKDLKMYEDRIKQYNEAVAELEQSGMVADPNELEFRKNQLKQRILYGQELELVEKGAPAVESTLFSSGQPARQNVTRSTKIPDYRSISEML